MITKYNEYKIEALLESLILESKLDFSNGLKNILISMKGNKIADNLIRLLLDKVDANFTQNYVDISKDKDMVTFIPDRKAQEILGKENIRWVTSNDVGDKYFTHNKNENDEYRNRHLFDALGYTPEGEGWVPISGTVGDIKAETISKKSGKTAVWFVSDDGRQCVINKEALVPHSDSYPKLWNTSRSPLKVGRLAKSILDVAGVPNTPKEIEDFVNLYKSTFDITNDAFSKFNLVSGSEIARWYNVEKYESDESTLGNSCMAEVDSDFFDIYVENPSVCSLLILYSNNGSIQNGKYTAGRIKGRALVWKTDQGDTLMDRIYTNYDSDVSLFKQYAENQGWWYKTRQNSDNEFTASNGKSQKDPIYTVKLESADFNCYPYVDTMTYLNLDNSIISNSMGQIDAQYELDSTSGYREEL